MVSKRGKSISSQLGGKKCDNPDKQKESFTKVFVSFFLLNALEASISATGNLVVNYFFVAKNCTTINTIIPFILLE